MGILYIGYALIFLVVGGVEALLIRVQLFFPNNHFISPYVFNRLFTMHGTTMVFLVGMPILFGFGNYLVPLMIGARDMAFPRLNAFSFWLSAFGGLLLYYSFIGGVGLTGTGAAPDIDWFAYAPLTERAFSPGHSTDYWALALHRERIGSIGTAINIIATVFCMRCKGMTLLRMPLLAWLYATVAGLVLIADQSADGSADHADDRSLPGRAFLRHAGGRFGDSVGALLLDLRTSGSVRAGAAGVCIRERDHSGVFAEGDLRIPGDGGGVGGHCVYQPERVGTPHVHDRDDVVRQCVLHAVDDAGVDSDGHQNFQLAGDDVGRTSALRDADAVLDRVSVSVGDRGADGHHAVGGPWNWQLHNSYFVVAHFHYVLVGAIVFMIFAAIYYWYPKMTGRMLDERLGKWHFWLLVIGFHMTFDTMHVLGFAGYAAADLSPMSRTAVGHTLNLVISIGGLIQGIAIAILVYNLVHSYFKGREAGQDPWDAWTLEWATPSPPPAYNFAVEPVVASRRPLWDLKHPDDPDSAFE